MAFSILKRICLEKSYIISSILYLICCSLYSIHEADASQMHLYYVSLVIPLLQWSKEANLQLRTVQTKKGATMWLLSTYIR